MGNGISNNKFNKYIKDVCRIVGLDRKIRSTEHDLVGTIQNEEYLPLWSLVSSHTGRRTFVWEQVQRGVPTRVIMSMTGHRSRKVFDMYYEVLENEKTLVNDDLFMDHEEDNKTSTSTTKTPEPHQETTSPFSKEQEEELQQLKYSLDKGWITQDFFEKKFNEIRKGE